MSYPKPSIRDAFRRVPDFNFPKDELDHFFENIRNISKNMGPTSKYDPKVVSDLRNMKGTFHYANQDQLTHGLIAQVQDNPIIHALTRAAAKHGHPGVADDMGKKLYETGYGTALGTIYKNNAGKKVSLVDEGLRKEPKAFRRMVIAHEAFHAKTPIIGRSETLAHLYGGFRSGAKPTSENGVFGQYGHLWKTRPLLAAAEHAVAGGAAYGTVKGLNKLRKKDNGQTPTG